MQSSSDERTLAALAHASIVTNGLSLIGLIGAAMIWATQRERSAYVRGHAIQALVFQGMVFVIALVLLLSWGLCVALSLLPIALRPELYPAGNLPGPFWLALSGMILPILFGLAASLYGLFGAFQVYRGKPFFYPIVGRLAYEDLQPGVAVAMPAETPGTAVTAVAVTPSPAPVATPSETPAPPPLPAAVVPVLPPDASAPAAGPAEPKEETPS